MISDYSFKYVCVVCYSNLLFSCLICSAMSNLLISHTEHSSEILILKLEMLLEFQNKMTVEIIGF